jgi:hypothetical protein
MNANPEINRRNVRIPLIIIKLQTFRNFTIKGKYIILKRHQQMQGSAERAELSKKSFVSPLWNTL